MIAIMLPSYGRPDDLAKVLDQTPLDARARFVVVANYDPPVYQALARRYAGRATFVDERAHGKLGGCGAYNLAYATALDAGYDYAVHYADDVLPADADWLDRVEAQIIRPGHVFGVFSSDECHYGSFGWNIVRDVPIAHFYVMKCGLLGPRLFDPRYKQYVIDLDLAVKVLDAGHEIRLMPVRLRHYRSPLNRAAVSATYAHDEKVFYEINPRFDGLLAKEEAQRYVPDEGRTLVLPAEGLGQVLRPWPAHAAPRSAPMPTP